MVSQFKSIKNIGLGFLSAALFFIPAVQAEDFSADQKKQVEAIIQNYINENPEIITQALEHAQIKREEAAAAKAQKSILENMDRLTGSDFPSLGKEDAAVTVVEFFDYNCGYCKRAVPDIQAISKENDDVRFVFIEMPILGPTSLKMAQYALAAHKQDRYFDYHVALMEDRSPKQEEHLLKIGKDIGLDVKALKADASSDAVKEMLLKSMELSETIGIRGTPAFIVEGELFRGYMGKEGLEAEILDAADAKKKG